jgi:peptidoglycan/xylan/chitin deacetylase (PgdA/CDA1 family)
MRIILLLYIFFRIPTLLIGQNSLVFRNYNSNSYSCEIATFYHFKKAAVTFTFDDGFRTQYGIGVSLLDSFEYKGTFYSSLKWINYVTNWEKIQKMINNGHEIGSHGIAHPNLTKISIDSAKFEIEQSKKLIEQNLKNYKCLTFAYPYGAFNEPVKNIISFNYIAARIGLNGLVNSNVNNFYTLRSFFYSSTMKLEDVNNEISNVLKSNSWLIEVIHGIDGEGYDPIQSTLFRKHLKYVKEVDKDLWVTTLVDVAKYTKERLNSKIIWTDIAFSSFCLNIVNKLADSLYNFPLSLKVKVPKYWEDVHIIQNNLSIDFKLDFDNTGNYVVFDAVPNKGKIKIFTDNNSLINYRDSAKNNFIIYPNPFNQILTILSKSTETEKAEFMIYNSQGVLMVKGKLSSSIFDIETSNWKKDVYIVIFTYGTGDQKLEICRKIFKKIIE